MNLEVFSTTLAWLLVGIFLPALHHKLTQWQRFVPALGAYRLLPDSLQRPMAAALVIGELGAVAALVLMPPLGFALAGALFGVYLSAMVINLLRGRRMIDCGCGDTPTALSWALVLRNALLCGCAGLGLVMNSGLVLDLAAQALGLALALIGLVIYYAAEELFANATRHRRLWLGEVA
ncbi:MAG: MauE/DoxX family redox-associated membrane protein [Pseudomonadota bacterium]